MYVRGYNKTDIAKRFLDGIVAVSSLLILHPTHAFGQFPEPIDSAARYVVHHSYASQSRRFVVNNNGGYSGLLISDGGLWIGGIVGRDTIVSAASDGWGFSSFFLSEFNPGSFKDQLDAGTLPELRTILGGLSGDTGAKSFEDIVFVYSDTPASPLFDETEMRQVGPLPVSVVQTSYYWPVDYAQNILLLDYGITNIGLEPIREAYLGLFFDGFDGFRGPQQDTVRGVHGFLMSGAAFNNTSSNCSYSDVFDIPWYANPDGLPNLQRGEFDSTSIRFVIGLQIHRPDNATLKRSWNWWNSSADPRKDFGPRKAGTPQKPFRDWGPNLGTPRGDRNRYHVLSNEEIDYDQFFTAIDQTTDGWLPPPADVRRVIEGRFDTHALYSIGPLDINPGQQTHFTVSVIVSDSFHTIPEAFWEKFDEHNPQSYYETDLDFSSLIKDATIARWIYDNPGVDTDKDGFRGEYRLCANPPGFKVDTITVIDSSGQTIDTLEIIDSVAIPETIDTIWVKGDGVPDFRGAMEPGLPNVRYTPERGRIVLEWNGLVAETTKDFFTQEVDFEGYRVYLGLLKRRDDMLLQSSYDIEDYTQWYFGKFASDVLSSETYRWVVLRKPFSLQEARAVYSAGIPNWHPLQHGLDNPLHVGDSLFYFTPQDWNQSDFRDTTAIHKIYPDEPYPHTLNTDSAFSRDTLYTDPVTGETTFYQDGELTPDRKHFKYFEYRYIFDNLLPSQEYYVAITAFDFGSPENNLPFLETNPLATAVKALAQDRIDPDLPDGLNVVVYPNPYRIDGNYRKFGFEGRGREDMPDERVREVHFTNLPPVCDIKIYSLDGDMVRQIPHNKAPNDPSAMHESWDVLSRNLQIPVSGIYYWVVETPQGEVQVGKLVLIM